MIDCHGEKKHLTRVAHTMTKIHFGGLGQITDTITKFSGMNEMFFALTHSLENVSTNVPKLLRKTVFNVSKWICFWL